MCSLCNELSGRYVDGEFIKSWFVAHERSNAAREYLDARHPEKSWLPLSYMGVLEHSDLNADETAEVWLGPCGDHIVHIRPKQEPEWDVYAGGKPNRKRAMWGSAYLTLCTKEPFWIWIAVNSFHRHFKLAERYVLNMPKPEGFKPPFSVLDANNSEHARKERIPRSIQDTESVHLQIPVRMDLSARFLAKIALGIGRELLGDEFLDTSYAGTLRAALWERDHVRRSQFAVPGRGYLSEDLSGPGIDFLRWPGSWVIWVNALGDKLSVTVVSPSGKIMVVQVSDDPQLVRKWAISAPQGQVFVIAAAIDHAVGPIEGAEFFAHQIGNFVHPDLENLNSRRTTGMTLPPCR